MAYREYDDEIFRNYFIVSVMDVVYALITEAERRYGENYQSIPGMYNDEEAFNRSMVVMLIGAAIASDETLQVHPYALSEPLHRVDRLG